MSKIYFISIAILLISICPLKAQKLELPIVGVKTMSFEKIKGTIYTATEFELVLTQKGIESPYHMKAQNIRKIHIPSFPTAGPWGAIIGAGIGMLPGAIILVFLPEPGFLDLRRLEA